MKKLFALFATLVLLAGCSSTPEKPSTATPVTSTGEVDYSKTLLIYSNSASDERGEFLKEISNEAGFNIEVVPIPGTELTNRLIAEKNNPQADFVFGLNTLEYERLKSEDVLLQFEVDWKDEVDMTLGDKDGYYYPIVIQPLVLIYNNEMLNPPSDWTDLLAPEYKDQYNIFSLGGGTGKTIYASIVSRYPDENGEYGISDEGWEVAKQYIQNAHIEIKGEDYVGNVISGDRPMSMMWGSGVIQNQNERDYQFGVMAPEIGVPYVTEQVALINGSDKTDLALAYANWFGSAEVQGMWTQKFGTIPANPTALEMAPQDVKDFINKVKPQNMDWGFISENIDAWIEKAELEFVQ